MTAASEQDRSITPKLGKPSFEKLVMSLNPFLATSWDGDPGASARMA